VYSTLPTGRCQPPPRSVAEVRLMARFRAMPPDKPKVGETRASEPQTCGDIAQRDVIPPIHPGTDMARYERLGQVKIRGVSRRFSEPALLTARRLRCRMPEPAASTDLDSTGRIARYVAMEAQRTGELNYKRIFRRAAVDRYLKHQSRRFTIRTMRTLQGQLYEAGRVVHPQEFPRRQALQAPHVRRTGAASLTEIDDAYALAPTLPSALGRQLMVLLDLCYGAGARAADLKVLRGTSILETTWDTEPVAVVYLPNLAGGSRQVPVADREISERLIKLAASHGSRYLFASADGEVERNAANRVSERLTSRGLKPLSATALRNRWLVELATRVPAALMLQLADVETAQILSDQRDNLPHYDLMLAIALTKESL